MALDLCMSAPQEAEGPGRGSSRKATPRLVLRAVASLTLGLLASGLAACTGPTLSERLAHKPLTMHPPYRLRLAPYKIDGRPRPADLDRQPQASGRQRPNTARTTPVSDAPPRLAQKSRTPGARVNLGGHDLSPVYRWFSGKVNRQWILGDVVDVVASKEFFAQVLTTNAQLYMVKTEHRKDRGDTLMILTYLGGEGQARVNTTPRVMIHTGLTITARKQLRVRLAKTQDARRPVTIRVIAQGGASRGHGDKVEARGLSMQMRGVLVYDRPTRKWQWRAGFN